MKKIVVAVIGLLVGLCATELSADPRVPPTIVLVADEWPPYNMTPGGTQEGYIVDIVREVFAAKGIGVDYRIVPWARALEDTRAGRFDGVIGASTSDAPGFVFPTEPLAINRLGFFTRLDSTWVYRGHESVDGVSLGVIKGYDYRPWLSRYIETYQGDTKRVQVMVGDTPLESNLRKLVERRLDVVVDSQNGILFTAKTLGMEQSLRLAGVDPEPALIHVAFSPAKTASQELANVLAEGLAKLRSSGRLTEILAAYGLED